MTEAPAKPLSAKDPPNASQARSLAKAVSWRVVGTLDTLVLSWVIITFLGPFFGMSEDSHAENLETASYIAITEVVTKMVLYYLHERGWAHLNWDVKRDAKGRRREGPTRSAVKTGTWRVLASTDTFLLALIFTGNVGTAVSIGGFEVITKLALYFLHERVWSRISYGVSD